MARRSLTERYDGLTARRAELDHALLAHAQPTPVHTAMIDVLGSLLTLGNTFATDRVPAPLRAMMRTLDAMKPTLVEELANIPPDQIVAFMTQLRDELDGIVQAGAAITTPVEPPTEPLQELTQ